ncbi:hypothetical protein [Dokdonella sp.]|uniref:hypothetical protein n=1 Tax=Dokdonella sp. TaxID=2291710 RepID=UPI001B216343|nr:hypothetical protein [Dokdonella sp.]MBO9662317.1 hypothetical protein [Dokdonella sp.]
MTEPAVPEKPGRERHWDALAAVVAALIGFLALLVSGYTAYVQRQQVRAQVWPYLLTANYDTESALKVLNKGVGPAIVRSMRVWVDGKPQANWRAVITALGIEKTPFRTSTVSDNVVSGGEVVPMLVLSDNEVYRRFRNESARLDVEICYCSTLGDCWLYGGREKAKVLQAPVERCPVPTAAETFSD